MNRKIEKKIFFSYLEINWNVYDLDSVQQNNNHCQIKTINRGGMSVLYFGNSCIVSNVCAQTNEWRTRTRTILNQSYLAFLSFKPWLVKNFSRDQQMMRNDVITFCLWYIQKQVQVGKWKYVEIWRNKYKVNFSSI